MSNDYINVNVELYWAKLNVVDKLSGKYGVKLCNLSDAAAEKLWGWGIKPKTSDDKPEYGRYINCKSNFEIAAQFEDGEPVTEPIGNGTVATVRLKRRTWEYMNKKGVSADITKLTVTDFVPVGGADPGGDDEVF